MTRVVFFVTVLAALCYVSQANPVSAEIAEDVQNDFLSNAKNKVSTESAENELDSLSNVKNKEPTEGAEDFQDEFNALLDIKKRVTEEIEKIEDESKNKMEKLNDIAEGISNKFVKNFEVHGKIADDTWKKMQERIDGFVKLGTKNVDKIVEVAQEIQGKISEKMNLSEALKHAFAEGNVTGILEKFKEYWQGVRDKKKEIENMVADRVKKSADEFKRMGKDLMEEIRKKVGPEVEQLKEMLKVTSESIKEKSKEAIKKTKGVIAEGEEKLKEKGEEIRRKAEKLMKDIEARTKKFGEKVDEIKGKVRGAIEDLGREFDEWKEKIRDTQKRQTEAMKKNIKELVERTRNGLQVIQQKTKEFGMMAKEVTEKAKKRFTETFTDIFTSAKDWVSDGIKRLTEAGGKLVDLTENLFKESFKKGDEVMVTFKDMADKIGGIVNGKRSDVIDETKNIVTDAVEKTQTKTNELTNKAANGFGGLFGF